MRPEGSQPGDLYRRNIESNVVQPVNEVGKGLEKTVYNIPYDAEHVLGVYHNREKDELNATIRQKKGRYYLTKLLHILSPDHIPDIHLSTSNPATIIIDKVGGEVSDHIEDTRERYKLSGSLSDVVVWPDDFYENYHRVANGNLVYVDTFNPWIIFFRGEGNDEPYEIRPLYYSDGMEQRIMTLSAEQQKMALDYLERLNQLWLEEQEAFENGTLFN